MGEKHDVVSKDKGVEVSGSSMVQNHNGGDGPEIVSLTTSPLDDLPVDCISNIKSLMSPQDACVFSKVSKTFEYVVNSDIVLEKFLPSDYQTLFPSWQDFSSKKDLYFALCDPFLIQDGKKSLWLEKETGKKCVMLAPKELTISWGKCPQFWEWISVPESRFDEVPVVVNLCEFMIRGTMYTSNLSPGTRYSGYIVFKLEKQCPRLGDIQVEVGEESFQRFISFVGPRDQMSHIESRRKPEERKDGWMETELCEFFNEACCDDIELTVLEIKSPYLKPGLIIQGFEFRPTRNP